MPLKKIERIQQRGDMTRDEVLYDATLRNLQTLSEATQHLPEPMKAKFPHIPWKQISGFRNIRVHNIWAISIQKQCASLSAII